MLTAAEDYRHISESLDFGVGEVQACIDITIIDDDILEPVEQFTVELETYSDFVDIGNRNIATVNIFDNDSKQTMYSNMLHGCKS